MNVTVISEYPFKESITVEEYTDFRELKKKNHSNTKYQFPTGEQALTEMINGNCFIMDWETRNLVDKIIKPVVYRGIKLDPYFTWKGNLFMTLMGHYTFIGKTTK